MKKLGLLSLPLLPAACAVPQQSAKNHGFETHWGMVTHHGTNMALHSANTGFATASRSFNNRIVAGRLAQQLRATT